MTYHKECAVPCEKELIFALRAIERAKTMDEVREIVDKIEKAL